jgi:uncharacterized iron-regulated membrane protein
VLVIKRIHRWLGLAAALFWLIQASTGAALVFRWELDDALLPGAAAALSTAALGARIEAIERTGGKVSQFWATGGATNRFEIFYGDATGTDRVLRVNGAGEILRDRAGSARFADGAIFGTLTKIHHTLLAGEKGEWIVRVSGLLLATNLLLALRLAWPAAGSWKRVLSAPTVTAASARLYHWHRMIGLWAVLPLLLVAVAGMLLTFKPAIQQALDAGLPMPSAQASTQMPIGRRATPAQALEQALQRFPGAELSGFSMPVEGSPWFTVFVRVPGEGFRKWGASAVFVSSRDGEVLLAHDARSAPPRRKLINALYPFHTGQLGGVVTRACVLLSALGLIVLIILGARLWWVRRA